MYDQNCAKKILDRCKINVNYPIEYDFRAKLHFSLCMIITKKLFK